MSHIRASFVIPLYRKEYLQQQLEYIISQKGFDKEFEVIYVENPGKTKEAADIIASFQPNNVYHLESEAGANRARNVGIASAKGSHIILLDDDCYPEANLLQGYMAAFMLYPGAAVYGGRVLHTYYARRPKWFYGYFKHAVGFLDRGEDTLDVSQYNWEIDGGLISANLAFKKSAWKSVGGFKENIGQQSGHQPAMSNADEILFINEAAETAKNERHKKMYVGRAVVWHQITASRMTIEYLLDKTYGHGCGVAESLLMSKSRGDYFQEDLISECLLPVYWSTLSHIDLQSVRQEICHEESTRIFIKNAMLCRAKFIQGFCDTLATSNLPSYEDKVTKRRCFIYYRRKI